MDVLRVALPHGVEDAVDVEEARRIILAEAGVGDVEVGLHVPREARAVHDAGVRVEAGSEGRAAGLAAGVRLRR